MPAESTASKLLWFILLGVTSIACAAIGSWAMSVDQRINSMDARQITLEKTNVEVNTKLDILIRIYSSDRPHIRITPTPIP